MRLSEAIRLGAMLKPQGVLWMLRQGTTCALGAAADALHLSLFEGQTCPADDMHTYWPLLLNTASECPSCKDSYVAVVDVVTHLNDQHRWTREAIADWVATIETMTAFNETVHGTRETTAGVIETSEH